MIQLPYRSGLDERAGPTGGTVLAGVAYALLGVGSLLLGLFFAAVCALGLFLAAACAMGIGLAHGFDWLRWLVSATVAPFCFYVTYVMFGLTARCVRNRTDRPPSLGFSIDPAGCADAPGSTSAPAPKPVLVRVRGYWVSQDERDDVRPLLGRSDDSGAEVASGLLGNSLLILGLMLTATWLLLLLTEGDPLGVRRTLDWWGNALPPAVSACCFLASYFAFRNAANRRVAQGEKRQYMAPGARGAVPTVPPPPPWRAGAPARPDCFSLPAPPARPPGSGRHDELFRGR